MNFSGVGRLVQDPVVRKQGDVNVCQFKLAMREHRGDKENTQYLNFEVWDSSADALVKQALKGDSVYVEAIPRNDKREGRNNEVYFRVKHFQVFQDVE